MFNFLSYNKKFSQKQNEYNKLLEKIAIANKRYDEIQKKLNIANSELKESENIIEMTELGIEYIPYSNHLTDIQKKINNTQKEIANLIGNNNCTIITRVYKINNSEKKGQSFQDNYCKNLLIGFDSYCKSREKSITSHNYYKNIDLIKRAFDKYNKMGDLIGASINPTYLNLKLKIIELKLDEKIAKEKEKNREKEEKARLREQAKLLEEAEIEHKKLEEEKKAMDIAFNKALTDEEREQIKNKLTEIDKRISDVDYRVSNAKAGYLYIISSPALPNMIKIGCTRRLNPTIRVRELSSSSLPYPFHAHCFVFSDNVFELESNMHKFFNAERVTQDKEFFNITPEEAINALKNKFKCEIYFNEKDDDNETD